MRFAKQFWNENDPISSFLLTGSFILEGEVRVESPVYSV